MLLIINSRREPIIERCDSASPDAHMTSHTFAQNILTDGNAALICRTVICTDGKWSQWRMVS